jgi:hypothetical protein
MLNQSVRIPRWRAVVLCLAGVLAMIKPLQTGLIVYRDAVPPAVHNYSNLYGWVEPAGPFNSNELWRAESKLRLVAYPRESFTRPEIERAAAEVRAAGWAEIRREQAERAGRLRSAWADRTLGMTMVVIGAGGVGFYVWLGCALIRESDERPRDPHAGWFGRKKRHGRITFGRAYAEEMT